MLNAFNGTFSSISTSSTQTASSPTSPALAPVSVDQVLQSSVECPAGGSIRANGSLGGWIDDESLASDLTFDITFGAASCVVVTPETSLTVGGGIELFLEMFFDDTQYVVDGSEQGTITYSAQDGRSGSCRVDVSFSTDVDRTSNDVQQAVTGTVCGVSANRFVVMGG